MPNLTDQTKKMCKSMPQLAKWLEDCDTKGHEWVIVSWRDTPPWRVTLNEIVPLSIVQIGMQIIPNLFTSRTSTLRHSEATCHHITNRSEEEHWGVWKWIDECGHYCQSALPAAAFNMATRK